MTTTAVPSGLARKIKKILDTRTEAPEFLTALGTLGRFYHDNSPQERRKLRSTIEAQGLSINQDFLKSAGSVCSALDTVDGHSEALSECCRAVSSSLTSSKAASADILAISRRVNQGLESSEERTVLVELFLRQYRLSHDEIYSLNEAPITAEFFEALERVRVIHRNCRTLLRGHHPRAGLELLDSLSLHQETAFERLCRWVNLECRTLGDSEAPEPDPLLQYATQALRARPPLFRFCAEELAVARHAAMFQRFINALTRGGPNGTPRPIEMHAHDPHRYVGDMVAWVHQSLASEREFLVHLLGEEPPAGGEPGLSQVPTVEELLDRISESICKPLKVRIEQVIAGGPQLLVCFRVAQLLSFYAETIAKLAGLTSAIATAVTEAQQAALQCFREQLAASAQKLSQYPPKPATDLSPPPQVVKGLRQVLEVIVAFESTYRTTDTVASSAAAELGSALAAAVDPLVNMCRRSSQAQLTLPGSGLNEPLLSSARRIYLINCLVAIQGPLAAHAVSAPKANALGQDIEANLGALAESHVKALLSASAPADDVLDRIRHHHQGGHMGEGNTDMSGDPALGAERLQQAARAFVLTVSNPAALPEFEQLQVPRLKADAAARVVRSLADAYDVIWTAVTDPGNGYSNKEAPLLLPHTPEQIRTILGVVI